MMALNQIRLSEWWDGTGYIVLSQSQGFNYTERKYTQGILNKNLAFLFNEDSDINPDLLNKITELICKQQSPPKEEKA